jgi:hypothetical protein
LALEPLTVTVNKIAYRRGELANGRITGNQPVRGQPTHDMRRHTWGKLTRKQLPLKHHEHIEQYAHIPPW